MQINQDNYEQYFLDHAEGNLSPEMERELADFLDANPDLKPVLDDFDPSPLQTVEIRNEILKRRIKKKLHPTDHISEDNIDEWMIREVEGLLHENEENELKEFLTRNPAYEFDHKNFRLTKLVPDQSITFSRKNELKKEGTLVPIFQLVWSLSAVAAVIILIIGIRFFQKTEVRISAPVNTPEIVSVTEIPESNPSDINAKVADPEMPANETLSETPSQMFRPASFHLKPSVALAVISPNPAEISEISLVAYNISPIMTAEKKEKPLIAKVFGNMVAKARDGINVRTNPDKISKPDLSFWSIAKAGIDGYNSISDRDLELYVRKDTDGKVKSYALVDQERLIWSKDLNKD